MAEEDDPQADPSMEDILASIRSILADGEEAGSEAPEAAPEPKTELEPGPELRPEPESRLEPEPEIAPEDSKPEPELQPDSEPEPEIALEDLEFKPEAEPDPAPEPEPEATVSASSPLPPKPELEQDIFDLTPQMIAQPTAALSEQILSQASAQVSTDALQELARALLSKRDIAIGDRDLTLEGLVREILRPLLREWMDQNLPYLIERLVKKEIDHMINRAERLDQ